MQLTPPEQKLIKHLQHLNKIFIRTRIIPTKKLEEFCSIVLNNESAACRFVAMFESCYQKEREEQRQFYELSRRIDELMVAQMDNHSMFKKYDKMMGDVMDSMMPNNHSYSKYRELYNEYSKKDSFQFQSIVIPKRVKVERKVFKFNPANLM